MRKWKTSLKEAPGFYSNLGQRADKIKRHNVTPHYTGENKRALTTQRFFRIEIKNYFNLKEMETLLII